MGYFDDLWPNTQAPKMAVLQGGSVYSSGKLVTGVVGTAYKRLLLPADLMKVSSQGATPEQILVSAWGACGTATGETFTTATPYLGSQMTDSLGLAIPSAPQPSDSIRVRRDSLTSSRVITHKITKQKRQPFVQDVRPLDGIIVKHYGTYSFVDANGVTHQPPGKRDPVVQLPGVGAHIDNDTIKFDANGQMYADLFGQGAADGSGASQATVGGLKAGHGIELIPGFIPTESPTVVVEAGGSVPAGSYSYMYVWLYGTVRTPQSPSVSCTTIDGPPTTYHQPHLTIPGKDDINHATGVELYRKDAAVGANGTIQTKFAYTSSPGVLISDPSTGASLITTGAYTGMYQWTATSTTGNVQAGDEWEYNPLIRVKVGIPPIPYDPRDGSLTTLIINGAQDGSSVFKTSDGGALNPVTGAITYPQDNPLNHSGFRLVDTLPAQAAPYDYIDTKTDAMLGALYVKQATSINVKPARYLTPPFSSMAAVPGTTPPLYELSGLKFSSSNPTVSNDGVYVNTKYGTIIDKNNNVDVLLAASGTLPATGTGDQTARALAGYDANVYNKSALTVTGGDSATGLAVLIDGTTIKQTATGALMAVGGGGGGGGGGTGSAVVFSAGLTSNYFLPVSAETTVTSWDAVLIDDGGWQASVGSSIVVPVTGDYRFEYDLAVNSDSGTLADGYFQVYLYKNGTTKVYESTPQDVGSDPDFWSKSGGTTVRFVAGDVLTVHVDNETSVDQALYHDNITGPSLISFWLIDSGFTPAVLRVEGHGAIAVGNGSTDTLQWPTTDTNIGGFTVSGSSITIPMTGEYEYSFVSANFGHGSNTPVGTAEFALNINGSWDSRWDYRTQCQDPTGPINVLGTMVADFGFSATAGDVITITIGNFTAQTLSTGSSYLMINRVG